MTLSVIYYQKDNIFEGIKSCADSRISSGNENNNLLTNHSMKILPLTVSFMPEYESMYGKKKMCYEVGFTYAGNIAVVMQVYTILSYFCKQINIIPSIPTSEITLPSLSSISHLASDLLYSYEKDFGSIMGDKAKAEIVIFGFCSQTREYTAFHIKNTIINNNMEKQAKEINIAELPYFAIGTGAKKLERKVQDNNNIFSSKLVREIINDDDSQKCGVGGFYQRAWCQHHLRIYNEAPQNDIKMPLLGNFPPVIHLGTHFISLPSMMIDD